MKGAPRRGLSLRLLVPLVGRFLFGSVRRTLFFLLAIVLVPELAFEVSHYQRELEERRAQGVRADLEVARTLAVSIDKFVSHIVEDELALGAALASPLPVDQSNRLLAANARAFPWIRAYSWTDTAGRVVASSDPQAIGQDFSDLPHSYLGQITQGQAWAVSDLLQGQGGDLFFTVATGIRDDAGALQGVLGAVVDPRELGRTVATARTGEASTGLIDRQGRLAYRFPEIDLTWEARDVRTAQPFIVPALAGEEVSGTFTTAPDGRSRIVAYVPIHSTGWIASAGRPEEEAVGPVKEEICRESALILLLTAGSLLVAMAVGRRITVPIRRVGDYAAALGRGEGASPVAVSGPRELGDLADAFNRMAGEIVSRREELQRLYETERSAHARAEEATQTLEALVQASPLAINVMDGTANVTMWNPACERIFGWTADEVLGRPNPTVPEEGREGHRRLVAESLEGKVFSNVELRRIRKDGLPVDVSLSTAPLFDASHKTVATMGIIWPKLFSLP